MLAAPLSSTLLANLGDTEVEALTPTFLTMGAIYLVMMVLGAVVVRVPPKGWKPQGWGPSAHRPKLASGQVNAKNAIKTWSFWMLWIVLFTNVTAGIGILENAKPMIEDLFPAVSAAAAAGFVGLLSLANMGGRIGWSSASDFIGRKRVYMIFLGVGAIAYTLVATVGPKSMLLFVLLVVLILTFYGGGFATIPAYLKDVFGEFEVGAIHGRLLTAWSAAGIAGPLIVNGLLDFLEAKGYVGADLYRPSMLVMVGVLLIGFTANLLVRKIPAKYHEPEDAISDHDRVPVGAAKES